MDKGITLVIAIFEDPLQPVFFMVQSLDQRQWFVSLSFRMVIVGNGPIGRITEQCDQLRVRHQLVNALERVRREHVQRRCFERLETVIESWPDPEMRTVPPQTVFEVINLWIQASVKIMDFLGKRREYARMLTKIGKQTRCPGLLSTDDKEIG